ncbi:NAD(P)H-dependent flavin oxidoreductase [Thermodesulfobacteriota bacterium]
MDSKITKLIGIKYPIIQGAMAWVSLPPLVAAVSNAGGLGILGGAIMSPEQFRKSIQETKSLTSKPFGINFITENPEREQLLDILIEEKVAVVSYGKGDPIRIIERTKPHGIINLPTMGTVNHAVKAEQDGADAVIVQGTEGGGHTSFVATSILIPLVADRINIPIVAAGGFGDGRGLVAALALGAEGISMGSRFMATRECPIPLHAKKWIIRSSEEDTVVTDNLTGIRCRVLKNKFSQQMLDMKECGASPWELMAHATGRLRKALDEGDLEEGCLLCGQVAGMIADIPTCDELIQRIIKQAEKEIDLLKKRIG